MRRAVLAASLAGAALTAAGGLALAQDGAAPSLTAPPATSPPQTAPTATSMPTTPAAAALANAITPDEAPAPPPEKEAVAPAPKAAAEPETPAPPPEPLKRPRLTAAVLQAVDKITAETIRFEAKVGEPLRYKGLVLTVHACETTAADEEVADSIASVSVQSQPEPLPGRPAIAARDVFQGWIYASSPGLHPFEHQSYDLWLIACKAASPAA